MDSDGNSTISVKGLTSIIKADGNSTSTTNCSCSFPADDKTSPSDSYSYDALLYIIVVLSFYAMSMVLLMIKYIRREEEEISLDFYYTEFVKREKFRTANFKNSLALQKVSNVDMLEKMAKSKNEKLCLRPFDSASCSEDEAKVSVVTEGLSNKTEPEIIQKDHCSVINNAKETTKIYRKGLENRTSDNFALNSDATQNLFGTSV